MAVITKVVLSLINFKANVMSATNQAIEPIVITGVVLFLCMLSYKLGQGDPIIVEKTVEVEVYDKGFCVSCYKAHNWDEMYVLMNKNTDTIR